MTYHLLAECGLEDILFSMASLQDTKKKKAISQFLLELRSVKPLIRGDDLKTLGIKPGPLYTKIFTEVLNEKLQKRLATKEDELAFVKNNLSALKLGSG
jgi:tRNA nucleotidyltransferase (CCA-adding enzyme)